MNAAKNFRFNVIWVVLGIMAGSVFLATSAWALTAGMKLPVAAMAAAPMPTPDPQSLPLMEQAAATDIAAGTATTAYIESPETDTGADLSGVECQLSPLYPEKILQWCGLITHYANERGLTPDLVAALVWQESGGDPLAYSKSGAVGLMQVMPSDGISANFMCKNGPCFSSRPNIEKLQDPEFNISYGTKMLAGLLNRHGDIREALKSYGPMDVGYYYADTVLSIFQNHTQSN